MNDFRKQPIWNGLISSSQCAFCSSSLEPLEAKLLDDRGERKLIHVNCRRCEHSMLAIVSVSEKGIFSIGMLTDCSPDDAMRFKSAGPISSDEVLHAHLGFRDGALLGGLLQFGR
jgi:hypothetical protein